MSWVPLHTPQNGFILLSTAEQLISKFYGCFHLAEHLNKARVYAFKCLLHFTATRKLQIVLLGASQKITILS